MDKKKYFMIASGLGIIISIISLFTLNVSEIIQQQLDIFNSFFENDIPQKILDIINNTSIYYISIILGIFFSVIILIIVMKGNINKNKTILMVLSILTILFCDQIGLIGLVNFIVLLNVKKDKKEKVKEEDELPILDEPIRTKNIIFKSLVLICSYLLFLFVIPRFLKYFIDIKSNNITVIANLVIDIILLTLTLLLFFKDIKQQLKVFWQNIKIYMPKVFKAYLFSLLLSFIINFIIILIKGDIQESANQLALTGLPVWYLFFGSVIYAPVVEESVFRGSLRNIIKNNKLFIIISACLFGIIHTIGQEVNIMDTIVLALPYMAMGYVMANLYVKTNNIACNMALHALNNAIAVIILTLI